jgi:phosphatidate cytidylyltransferase
MLKQRILTVAVLLPLFLAALFLLPNLYWGVLTGAVLGVAAYEWSRLAGYAGPGRWVYPALLVASALAVLTAEHGLLRQTFIYSVPGRLLYGLTAVVWLVIVPAWLYFRWPVRDPVLLALIGALVLLPFWHALTWLQLTPGRLLAVMGVVWTADIAAYFTGRAFGRHQLAPQISPGKTWEGVAGAFVAVALYWSAIRWLVPGLTRHLVSGLVLVMLLTTVGILGDLFESWIKRVAGFKDSGTLLPGHGGVLDRVDALTSTLPLAALYFAYPLFWPPNPS